MRWKNIQLLHLTVVPLPSALIPCFKHGDGWSGGVEQLVSRSNVGKSQSLSLPSSAPWTQHLTTCLATTTQHHFTKAPCLQSQPQSLTPRTAASKLDTCTLFARHAQDRPKRQLGDQHPFLVAIRDRQGASAIFHWGRVYRTLSDWRQAGRLKAPAPKQALH